ncbi:MAG: hypothetical protein KDA43_13545 [Hyphomonas sp.]|nr:hypothetical protein [Hyphomonas sp.]
MVLSISPLDDALIRFDAAAAVMARHNPFATAGAFLEMLVHATWRGDFNPPGFDVDPNFRGSDFNSPEDWLHIPIEAPRFRLTQGQVALRPRPFEIFEGSSHTLLSVMYCAAHLPGAQKAWDDLLDHGNGNMYLHGKKDALAALAQLPLSAYSEEAQIYLSRLFIPRVMLQRWLDLRSSQFAGVFCPDRSGDDRPASRAANDHSSHPEQGKRGRPTLAAWERITTWALQLDADFPDMPRKELAGRLHEMAKSEFGAGEVPSESTILRRLSSLLDNS